jgi:hypothetical protein
MKRIAIILSKNLTIGQSANVAAILGGAISKTSSDIQTNFVLDGLGTPHAAVHYSHLLLKAGEGQIKNLANSLIEGNDVSYVVFSQEGQNLFHSQFSDYKMYISSKNELTYIGIALVGEDEIIRQLTKKYSLL